MGSSALLGRYGGSAQSWRGALEEAFQHQDLLLVAEEQGSDGLLGLAWVLKSRGFGGAAYLRLLLVDERHTARGLGTHLLEGAERHATGWSRHLLLLVTSDNQRARRFYERHGYQRVGELKELVLAGVDEVLYQKRLA